MVAVLSSKSVGLVKIIHRLVRPNCCVVLLNQILYRVMMVKYISVNNKIYPRLRDIHNKGEILIYKII